MHVRTLKLLIICLVTWQLAGPVGVVVLSFCYLVLRPLALEEADKHGISKVTSSRMGGSVIIFFIIASLLPQLLSPTTELNGALPVVLASIVALYLLGVAEDVGAQLHALIRLLTIFLVIVLSFYSLELQNIRLPALPFSIPAQIHYFLLVLLVVLAAFFINSFNTADGANGLVSGIAIIFLVTALDFFGEQSSLAPLWLSAAIGAGVFFLVNVFVGRFFLGDGGAYALGGLVVATLWFAWLNQPSTLLPLLCLVLYPVIDLTFSGFRRLLAGRSPMSADNYHLHNLLYECLAKKVPSSVANSLTGISIVMLFCGGGYMLRTAPSELLYLLIFLQVAGYTAVWFMLDAYLRRPNWAQEFSQSKS